VTQEHAALVEEASAAAQALTEQAVTLATLIERYEFGDSPQIDRRRTVCGAKAR
jgi:hypothetical protein